MVCWNSSGDEFKVVWGAPLPEGRYYCNSEYGCFDRSHIGTGDPPDILRQVKHAINSGGGVVVIRGNISTPIPGVSFVFVGYYRISSDLKPEDAEGVALAIYMHWSIGFEAWEGTLPGGDATSFAIEDLPTHYLSFYMAANNLSREQAFALLGAFEGTEEDPTREVKNYGFNPMVQDEEGNYNEGSWPEAMQITPIEDGWEHIKWDQEVTYGDVRVSVTSAYDGFTSVLATFGPILFSFGPQ